MNLIVRAFVLVLAVTGAFASTHVNTASTNVRASISKTSAVPVPTCPPDDPNACGMAGW